MSHRVRQDPGQPASPCLQIHDVSTSPPRHPVPPAHRTARRTVDDVQTSHEDRMAITLDDVKAELRGRDAACYCPLDAPRHADVLMEVANT